MITDRVLIAAILSAAMLSTVPIPRRAPLTDAKVI